MPEPQLLSYEGKPMPFDSLDAEPSPPNKNAGATHLVISQSQLSKFIYIIVKINDILFLDICMRFGTVLESLAQIKVNRIS